ncbi:hypothetical protein [Streptomyces sp. NPDC002779]|uniref:hypothetical protein n=1 Tax=Streptomyces sp. NPDC002779 TaxID=3364664 RepID=UPI00369FDCB6
MIGANPEVAAATANVCGSGNTISTVTARNTTDNVQNYAVEVSDGQGDGDGWVASDTYRLCQVPAQGTKAEASTVRGTRLGPIPEQPNINRLTTYEKQEHQLT